VLQTSNKKALIKKKNSLSQSFIRNRKSGNRKTLNQKKNSFHQNLERKIERRNKKALNQKRNSFHQSFKNQIRPEKEKRNTGSVQALLDRFCLHPRTHPLPCLSLKLYSF
jgi:hypothetical protein